MPAEGGNQVHRPLHRRISTPKFSILFRTFKCLSECSVNDSRERLDLLVLLRVSWSHCQHEIAS